MTKDVLNNLLCMFDGYICTHVEAIKYRSCTWRPKILWHRKKSKQINKCPVTNTLDVSDLGLNDKHECRSIYYDE